MTPAPTTTLWDTFTTGMVGVIPGVLTVLLAALLGWGAKVLYQRLVGRKPDFVLKSRTDQGEYSHLELKRTRRRPAFAVVWGDGLVSSSSANSLVTMPKEHLGDIGGHESTTFMVPRGSYVWLSWADRKRQYSESIKIDGIASFDIRGRVPDRSGAVHT